MACGFVEKQGSPHSWDASLPQNALSLPSLVVFLCDDMLPAAAAAAAELPQPKEGVMWANSDILSYSKPLHRIPTTICQFRFPLLLLFNLSLAVLVL